MYSVKEKYELVDSYKHWWHSIDFGDNIVSNGGKSKLVHERECKSWFSEDFFSDKRVLDIGTWDGYYAFYAEKMGAREVVAVDKFAWELNKPHYSQGQERSSKKGFDIAKHILGSGVTEYVLSIEEMNTNILGGKFDSIIYAGIFYHLKDPFTSLEIVDSLLEDGGQVMVETHICNKNTDVPLMQFHPKNSLNNDNTNFWSPNSACLKLMFEEIGNYTVQQTHIINDRISMIFKKAI